MVKKGLGRGLEALLPEIEVHEEDRITEVPLQEISPNPYQPRKSFDEGKIAELAASIKEYGVLQPIILRRTESGLQLVAGERRLRAAKKADLDVIPAVIREIKEDRLMEIALIENLQREDLNPVDEALAYDRLIKDFDLTQDQLADKLGKSRSQIANYVRLLQLAEEPIRLLSDSLITVGHAKVLAGVEDLDVQTELARIIVRDQLSVRQAEELANTEFLHTKKRRKKQEAGLPTEYAILEDSLKVRIGALVKLTYKEGKGKIEIPFSDSEELQRIAELLMDTSGGDETESGRRKRAEDFVV